MSFQRGDQVGVCYRGYVQAGPATFLETATYTDGETMCTLKYPRGQTIYMNVNEFYIFPWLDHLKKGDPLPTHICLRNVLHKKIYDQKVRALFEKHDMDAEPGGVADILRACLGASAPKGSGRLSADIGLRWVRKKA